VTCGFAAQGRHSNCENSIEGASGQSVHAGCYADGAAQGFS
jgi:hypothetical protein